MISATQYRLKATLTIIYLIMFIFLGIYSSVSKSQPMTIQNSTGISVSKGVLNHGGTTLQRKR